LRARLVAATKRKVLGEALRIVGNNLPAIGGAGLRYFADRIAQSTPGAEDPSNEPPVAPETTDPEELARLANEADADLVSSVLAARGESGDGERIASGR
jgi:hypothetical protein